MTEIVAINTGGMITKNFTGIAATVIVKNGESYLYVFYGSGKDKVDEAFLLKGFKAMTWITDYHVAVICDEVGPRTWDQDILRESERMYRIAYTEE